MGTVLRPELSKKNKYYIDKHRHYELKHFCLQYPDWKKEYDSCCNVGPHITSFEELYNTGKVSDPTFSWVARRESLREKIRIIERAAIETDDVLFQYVLKGVTEGLSYTYLKTILQIPCSKDMYYELYRKFFWILDGLRG